MTRAERREWMRRVEAPTDKLVLAGVLDHVGPDGFWMSVPNLVAYLGLSDRAIQMALRRLEGAGLIVATPRSGRTTLYALAPPNDVHPRTTFTPEPGSPPNDVRPEPGSPTPERRSPKGLEEGVETPMTNGSNPNAPARANAGEVVAAYIEGATAAGRTIPEQTRARLGRAAKGLIPKTDRDVLLEAARHAGRRGLNPASGLALAIGDVTARGYRPRDDGAADRVLARIRAQEAAS